MSIDRKIGLEPGRGPEVGRDPREMRPEELVALGHSPMSPLKALRLRCIDCYWGCLKSVRCCTAMDCPSWPFRMGRNPWRMHASARRKQVAAATMPASSLEPLGSIISGDEENCS